MTRLGICTWWLLTNDKTFYSYTRGSSLKLLIMFWSILILPLVFSSANCRLCSDGICYWHRLRLLPEYLYFYLPENDPGMCGINEQNFCPWMRRIWTEDEVNSYLRSWRRYKLQKFFQDSRSMKISLIICKRHCLFQICMNKFLPDIFAMLDSHVWLWKEDIVGHHVEPA